MTVVVRDRVVRLTMSEFESLVADDLPEDVRRQVLDVPGMVETLAAVREPSLALQVDVVVAAGGRTHLGWVGADALALLLPVRDDVWQLMALPVDQVAASLARIVGLGPGNGAAWVAVELATNPFDQFFSADASVRSAALARHEVGTAWTLGVRSEAEEWLMAAGTGPGGSWVYEPRPDAGADELPMTARPVSASELYRRFSAIVPGLLVAG